MPQIFLRVLGTAVTRMGLLFFSGLRAATMPTRGRATGDRYEWEFVKLQRLRVQANVVDVRTSRAADGAPPRSLCAPGKR